MEAPPKWFQFYQPLGPMANSSPGAQKALVNCTFVFFQRLRQAARLVADILEDFGK